MSVKLVMVGGGKMGEALLGGLLGSGWATAPDVVVIEPLAARRAELHERFAGIRTAASAGTADSGLAPGGAAAAIIAVKPQHVEEACRAVATAVAGGRALSIAAGVPLAKLEAWLGPDVRIVRAMPNTPALVGAGASAIAGGSTARPDDLDWAEEVLRAVGTVVRVGEGSLDAVTGLSGSGPAYVFLIAEALIEAGVLVGLARDVSRDLAVQTLLGSARLLAESGDGPEALRAAVTSPGGTTAAGLRALESHGVRAAFLDAVVAATERSRQLGA